MLLAYFFFPFFLFILVETSAVIIAVQLLLMG